MSSSSQNSFALHIQMCINDITILFYRIAELIGYNASDLQGKSIYQYHHASDSEEIEKAFKTCESFS